MQEIYRPEKDLELKIKIFEVTRDLVCGPDARPFDKVKVSDICAAAGISRRTFYNHYPDKYAIASWFMETSGANSFAQVGLTLTVEEAMCSLAYTVERYGDFLSACGKSRYYSSTYSYILKLARDGLEHAALLGSGKDELPKELKLQIRFFAGSVEAAVSDWASGAIDCTAEEFATLLIKLVPVDLLEALSNPVLGKGGIPLIDTTKMQAERLGGKDHPVLDMFKTRPDGTRLDVR